MFLKIKLKINSQTICSFFNEKINQKQLPFNLLGLNPHIFIKKTGSNLK